MGERTAITGWRILSIHVCGWYVAALRLGYVLAAKDIFTTELEQFEMQKSHEQKAKFKDEKQMERDVV